MLESTERDVVIRILRDLLTGLTAAASLAGLVGFDLAAQIPDSPNAQIRAESVVFFCERQPWLGQGRHVLINLLNAIRALDPNIPEIIKRLCSIPLPTNPLDAELLDGGTLFLGREELRVLLPDLWTPAGDCVLRINGEPKWGKSYSFRFLKFLQLQNKPLIPIHIENPGPTTPARMVAETLVQRMGCAFENAPKLDNETPLRIGQLLADWVLNLALRSKPANWWFVLDNFDNVDLPDDTKEFVRQLALQIAAGLGRSSMRLILINYKAQLPRDVKRLQVEEVIGNNKEQWILRVGTYYDRLAAGLPSGKQPVAAKARDQTIADLRSAQDEKFLETLCDALEDDTDEFSRPTT